MVLEGSFCGGLFFSCGEAETSGLGLFREIKLLTSRGVLETESKKSRRFKCMPSHDLLPLKR